ncbi:4-hydroxy-tetrahydrodipicolinate synthase [Limnobacter litoralis]|uniref:4-hydroxy-tetrahydrodipicolinate synthase n=1 Tax=Limnobacter litoralis TaxID=481366 RepID=A0ABQ5YW47_9BURK|nr:4-hydroxy-tetrahydrodipicolinate synthase [Limnobacter litoralis]GLR27712.1 4-hydroxy-tetrahydrodipicolinate synthase [Limnobacter litoralis]
MITGSMVAIVTPMFEDGSLDIDGYRKLIDWHIEQGTDCIVAVGTTGESPTVDVEEHCELIRVTVEQCAGRIPVVAGTGGNSTTEAVELTEFARKVGAAASLQVVPYYNKPTQEGMYLHFRKVAESVDLPVILYNVPGRTVADLAHSTVIRLAQVDGVVGIKEATGNMERAAWLIREAPETFAVYSGDDTTAVNLMLMGGKGNISVTANIAPKIMHELCMAAIAGDARKAHNINLALMDLHQAMFCQANPIPVKYALSRMGKMAPGIRLPLTRLEAGFHSVVDTALRAHQLID